ncbi:protein Star-like isoform X2 [Hyalella azteca]|uniref:Protein Star-like isoform X2 n=1 Tax=Hyalella azteca TaxID=294128 RepID=A0A8B7NBN1_HYAAZ|nr:protein Star-like isoform X2 [Hyalella azteca]
MKYLVMKYSLRTLLPLFVVIFLLLLGIPILTKSVIVEVIEDTLKPVTEHEAMRSSPETEDLFFHPDLLGKNMRDEAVIQAAREALIAPAREGPYYLDNPRQKFYSQHGQDKHVKEIFRDMKGGFFFEVGALTGESLSNTLYLERELGWTGVLMEPTPVSYHVLKSKNRRAHIMRACLVPDTSYREPVFDIGREAWGNTLVDAEKTSKSVRVPCYPFYSILAALGNPVVDYMSLDVEGVELKVLKSIPWDDVKIRVITIEIFLLPEGPEALRVFMEEKGFKFIKQLDQDYLFINKQLSRGLNIKVMK